MSKIPFVLLTLALAIGFIQPGQAQEGSNRAALVVRYGDGTLQTACVRFAEEQITGLDLLGRSGIPYIAQQGGVGAAVCKIGNEGCDYPAEDCFCKRDGARSVFWSYHTLVEGTWRFSNLGAANVRARNGDVQGWAWGTGDSSGGAQPPAVSLAEICGEVAAAPTAAPPPPPPTIAPPPPATAVPAPPTIVALAPTLAPSATAEPLAEASATAAPTATAEPSATVAPSATVVPSATAAAATTAPAPTAPPAGVAAAPPAGQAATNGGLLAFAALALVLLAGLGLVWLRRR